MIPAEQYASLGALLEDALIQYKSETALIEVNRKETRRLSYLDVKREGEQLAAELKRIGFQKGDRAAILMSNQSRWLIAAYAIFHRGGVIVPLDYKLEPKEQLALLAHAKPKVLFAEMGQIARFSQEERIGLPPAYVSELDESQKTDRVFAFESFESGHAVVPPRVEQTRSDLATLVYSSGTSGRVKGCLLTHGNYLSQLSALTELFPMGPGDRYFSVLPTNHAIDFMCGFIGPFSGGATVVHQRALRPEFLSSTMKDYQVTHMALVPLILEAFERRIKEKIHSAPAFRRTILDALTSVNERLTQKRPNHALSRRLLAPIHDAFGGHLKLLFCGGAFVDKARAEFFYRLGIPVVIGYGLTEACTVATVNDLKPFRGDSVGKPVRGVEVKIAHPNREGVGEVLLRGETIMAGYLDDPNLTEETIVDGYLHTGDLGYVDASGHLHLVGRSKNMIVTAGGKNVYPEDVESAFDGLTCEEIAVLASNYIWPGGKLESERLIAVVREKEAADSKAVVNQIAARNQRLPEHKRVGGVLFVREPFPRTASMKLKRNALADNLREHVSRDSVQGL